MFQSSKQIAATQQKDDRQKYNEEVITDKAEPILVRIDDNSKDNINIAEQKKLDEDFFEIPKPAENGQETA